MARKILKGLVLGLVALVVAAPLAAYTIVLKDGTRIVAKQVHRIEGDRVIITLPSGTETFIPVDEVDLEATKKFNAENFDGAMIIEGGRALETPVETPKESTLGDMIASGAAGTRSRAPVRRPESDSKATESTRTSSGSVDLDGLRRAAYGDLDIMSEVRSYFTSQGLEAQVFKGTQANRPMVEVVASSESAVFKSLEVAAQALPQLQDRHGSVIEAMEILMKTSRGSAAGQFLLTSEMAESLNSGEVDVAQFFIRYVDF